MAVISFIEVDFLCEPFLLVFLLSSLFAEQTKLALFSSNPAKHPYPPPPQPRKVYFLAPANLVSRFKQSRQHQDMLATQKIVGTRWPTKKYTYFLRI